uniref:F-box domain-containing protein n=1 Tax=Leersia perrieri TaxID=77586 RepID=A0A0D9X8N5_9ORYZ
MEGSPPRRKPRPAAEPTLESLPTEILENIVARLSIREAIRTSAVSRAWRRRWESTPNLRFRWSRNEVDVAVIGPVLARYSCPIRSFWTGWVDMQDSALTDEWVVLLAEGRVESISLGFAEHNFRCFHTIHSAIFSCCELTELELENCHLPAAPSGFGGFPNLTRLELSMVTIPEHGESTLEAIISSATMLRCLNLKNVFADGDDEECPNIEDLDIERRRVGPSADALGSLPLDVLDNILSRLHIHEVVRTSALSRAWRRRWESLLSVDLTRSPGIAASDVDVILLRRAAPVRSFRLATRDRSWSISAFHDWLLNLSRRGGLQHLELTLRYSYTHHNLSSCLFSFRDLTTLRLYCCGLPHVPTDFAGFPNLKTLYLSVVKVQSPGGRELATLIAASPVLQELTLIDVILIGDETDEDWVIRASNLRKLTIVLGYGYHGRMEDLPRLEECCLFGKNLARYLMGMARVTKLTFYCNCMSSTEVDVLERLPFLFENLRSLHWQPFNMVVGDALS